MQKIIAHITDTHLGDPTALDRDVDPKMNLEAILDNIALDRIDDVIITGDLGEPDILPWLFEQLEDSNPGFKVILGNHDDFKEIMKYYKSTSPIAKNELYYTQEDEFYKYIFMDSSSGTVSDAQLEWLSSEVNTLKKIILFIHHPVLGLNTGMDNIYPLHNRGKVNEILQHSRHEVTIFCGHYHMPDKRIDGKIIQYITPSVAFQVKKNSQGIDINVHSFGYRLIILDEHSIHTRLVTNFYDHFTQKSG